MTTRKSWPLLIFAAVCTCLFPAWTADVSLRFSNSIFPIALALCLFLLLRHVSSIRCPKRMIRFTAVLGLIFSCMTCCGYYLETAGSIPYTSVPMLAAILCYGGVYCALLCAFWSWLEALEQRLRPSANDAAPSSFFSRAAAWLAAHPVILAMVQFVCWIPCYLATFPGGFLYDATNELNQITDGFNGNFPMLHSVIITRLLPALYRLTGTYNTGIAVYTIAQMLLASAIFTHIICGLYRRGVHRRLTGFFILYYALFPVIPMVLTQTVRDILFSLLLTYAVFLFWMMTNDTAAFMSSGWKPCLLGIVFVLALLSRNNNAGPVMYAAVFCVAILVWALYRRSYKKGSTLFAAVAVGSYLLLSALLVRLCQPISPADPEASLSVLSQPVVRAFTMEPELWTQDETVAYMEYFGGIDVKYVPENADPTKSRLMINGRFGDFMKFWLKIGAKHTRCYLDAILANTRHMWFPASVIDGYQELEVEDYLPYDKSYYFYSEDIQEPGIFAGLLPGVNHFYRNIGLYLSFEKIPLVSMAFSIGFQVWVLLNCAFYAAYRRCRHLYLPLAILLGYTLISAFVPLIILRYFIALFFALPLTVSFTLQPDTLKNGSC